MAAEAKEGVWADPFFVDALFSEEERSVRDRVRTFSDQEVIPIMADCWERPSSPSSWSPKLRVSGSAATRFGGTDARA